MFCVYVWNSWLRYNVRVLVIWVVFFALYIHTYLKYARMYDYEFLPSYMLGRNGGLCLHCRRVFVYVVCLFIVDVARAFVYICRSLVGEVI